MKNWLPVVPGPALAMATVPDSKTRNVLPSTTCSVTPGVAAVANSSGTTYPGPPRPVAVGSPAWMMKSGNTRCDTVPSKYPVFARYTNEFTVSGAMSLSSSNTMSPHDVVIVAVTVPLSSRSAGPRNEKR